MQEGELHSIEQVQAHAQSYTRSHALLSQRSSEAGVLRSFSMASSTPCVIALLRRCLASQWNTESSEKTSESSAGLDYISSAFVDIFLIESNAFSDLSL
jgi:hypothetical protein